MDPAKLSAVLDWPAPKTVKELQSFLGLVNYYNHFIRSFSSIAAPLHNLLRKGVAYTWGPCQEKAFNDLKAALASAPVLQLPDFMQVFTIDVDASDIAIGAVLQQYKDDSLLPVAYFSRRLTAAE